MSEEFATYFSQPGNVPGSRYRGTIFVILIFLALRNVTSVFRLGKNYQYSSDFSFKIKVTGSLQSMTSFCVYIF